MAGVGGIWKMGNIGFQGAQQPKNDPEKFKRLYQKLHMDSSNLTNYSPGLVGISNPALLAKYQVKIMYTWRN